MRKSRLRRIPMQASSTRKALLRRRAKRESPRWFNVDVRFVRKTRLVGLAELRGHRELSKMRTLARGNRLSITPVSADEWEFITRRLMKV